MATSQPPDPSYVAFPNYNPLLRLRLVLRISSILVGLATITFLVLELLLSGATTNDINFVFNLFGAIGGTSVIWSCIDLIVARVKKSFVAVGTRRHDGRFESETWGHPGWHIVMHFLLALLGGVAMTCGFVVWRDLVLAQQSWLNHGLVMASWKGKLAAAGASLSMFIHFCLFVLFCSDLEYNKHLKSETICVPTDGASTTLKLPASNYAQLLRPRQLPLAVFSQSDDVAVPEGG